MKTDWSHLEQFRIRTNTSMRTETGDKFGAFRIPCGRDMMVCVVSSASEEMPWDHVSLRMDGWKRQRVPTWAEMCSAKDLFFGEEEAVVQIHPPKSEYVNNHQFVLHLWKPTKDVLPLPPSIAV